eukprot:gnl/Dysnectes_brevis/4266_a5656_849.p1 GENE.gnl/Dysnectes_brevis/4266_a5656_849~~gnl/Dysnectes_brevis/4266_a5656_849.p1  ORF type:complete len:745 (+),score=97.18 gnl/Dysnectes_brevis/4266_a5656_849:71-2305(+)
MEDTSHYIDPSLITICFDPITNKTKRIGTGGFAFVLEAKFIGSKVAVKCPIKKTHSNTEQPPPDSKEAEKHFRLSHPRILTPFGVTHIGVGNDPIRRLSLVTEIMDTSLSNAVTHDNTIHTEGQILNAITQITSGIAYLHSKTSGEVIHADLKPDNVLMSDQDIKIADFGTAVVIQSGKHMYEPSAWSPRYCSPEQTGAIDYEGKQMGTKLISLKSDVFSLGGILYFLVTGKNPPIITGRNIYAFQAFFRQVIRGLEVMPSLPPTLRSGQPTPQWMTDLLESMWSMHPESRPDSITVLEYLERVNEGTLSPDGHAQACPGVEMEPFAPPAPVTPSAFDCQANQLVSELKDHLHLSDVRCEELFGVVHEALSDPASLKDLVKADLLSVLFDNTRYLHRPDVCTQYIIPILQTGPDIIPIKAEGYRDSVLKKLHIVPLDSMDIYMSILRLLYPMQRDGMDGELGLRVLLGISAKHPSVIESCLSMLSEMHPQLKTPIKKSPLPSLVSVCSAILSQDHSVGYYDMVGLSYLPNVISNLCANIDLIVVDSEAHDVCRQTRPGEAAALAVVTEDARASDVSMLLSSVEGVASTLFRLVHLMHKGTFGLNMSVIEHHLCAILDCFISLTASSRVKIDEFKMPWVWFNTMCASAYTTSPLITHREMMERWAQVTCNISLRCQEDGHKLPVTDVVRGIFMSDAWKHPDWVEYRSLLREIVEVFRTSEGVSQKENLDEALKSYMKPRKRRHDE